MNEHDLKKQVQEMMGNVQNRVVETDVAAQRFGQGVPQGKWLDLLKSASTWALVGAMSCWLMRGFFWRSGWGEHYSVILFIALVVLSALVDNWPVAKRVFPYRGLANFAIGCVGSEALWALLMWLARLQP